jgi:hypothetical protein
MSDELDEQPASGGDPHGERKSMMPADWDEAIDGPWDDEYLSEQALAEGADIELIVEYLNKHLDPERTEQVRRRLEEDAAFRDLAAPLLLTWDIPKHLERHPRPPGELERHWDEFTRRAGFVHQKRKARRRRLRLLGLMLFFLGLTAFAARKPLRAWYVTQRDFAAVPHRTGWIPLGDSTFVQLTPDASLRAARESSAGGRALILEGSARFRVLPLDSATEEPRRAGLVIRTRAGIISTGEAEFRVTTRGDSADVEVYRPSVRRFFYFVPLPTAVHVRRDSITDPIMLRELDRALLVRGRHPERLPAPTTPPDRL